MIIKVTYDHIKHGREENADACPLALALQSAGFKKASVGTVAFDYRVGKETHAARLPESAKIFRLEFDNGWGVQPFEFEVDATP